MYRQYTGNIIWCVRGACGPVARLHDIVGNCPAAAVTKKRMYHTINVLIFTTHCYFLENLIDSFYTGTPCLTCARTPSVPQSFSCLAPPEYDDEIQ